MKLKLYFSTTSIAGGLFMLKRTMKSGLNMMPWRKNMKKLRKKSNLNKIMRIFPIRMTKNKLKMI